MPSSLGAGGKGGYDGDSVAPRRRGAPGYLAGTTMPFWPSPFSLSRAASASGRDPKPPMRTRHSVPRLVCRGSTYAA